METESPRSLRARPYMEDHRGGHIYEDDEGGFDGKEEMNGVERVAQVKSMNCASDGNVVLASRTSELTIAFEGEVYVFPAVTAQKVQAVLLLLGGSDSPTIVPSSEFLLLQNAGIVGDLSQGSKLSQRIDSLVRFREKRKDKCFRKRIRYTCQKEVALRMHRKNGQFSSLKDCNNADTGNWEASNETTTQSICQHCGINEMDTPAMRRGPAGPRTLCNACGLMWANKGILRDLTKGGRPISSDQNEPGSPEAKLVQFDSEISVRLNVQDLLETDETISDPLPMHTDSSIDLDEQDFRDTLDKLGNVSGSEFEIPGNFDD